MNKFNILKSVILCLFLSLVLFSAQSQNRYKVGLYVGGALPLGSFASDKYIEYNEEGTASFYNAASMGASFSFRYVYSWDGIFSEKDALGFFGEGSLIWNSVKKNIREEFGKSFYLHYNVKIGPSYTYYLGRDEELAIFGELGILLGSTYLHTKDYKLNVGIGAGAGAGIYYMEWLTVGIYYDFLGVMKLSGKSNEGETKKIIPHILQLKVGFHF